MFLTGVHNPLTELPGSGRDCAQELQQAYNTINGGKPINHYGFATILRNCYHENPIIAKMRLRRLLCKSSVDCTHENTVQI